MGASVEAVDCYIELKFKMFLVWKGGDKISVSGPQNLTYTFADTVREGHGSNRGKEVINLSTGEVPVAPVTRNYIILDSDGKI